MNLIPHDTELSYLTMGETLLYFDGPLLFIALGEGKTFLCLKVDDTEIGENYHFTQICDEKLKRLKEGYTTVRECVLNPDGQLWAVFIGNVGWYDSAKLIDPLSIPEHFLSGKESFLVSHPNHPT